MSYEGTKEEVDLVKYPHAKELYNTCLKFFDEVQNLFV